MDHLHSVQFPHPNTLPKAEDVRNGIANGPAHYQIDIRILEFEVAQENGIPELVFKEDLDTPYDCVFSSGSRIVAEAVAQNLEGHLLRSLPFDMAAVEEQAIGEALL